MFARWSAGRRGGILGKNRGNVARHGVGDRTETISFNADGRFVSQERRRGFISNTLGQGITGTIRGTWAIKGKTITLNISSAEDVSVLNKATTSTIEAFKPNELVVKSATGDTSTFVRAL